MPSIRIRQLDVNSTSNTTNDLRFNTHRTATIADIHQFISVQLKVKVSEQKLYHGGKLLKSVHTISDYKINDGDVIQFIKSGPIDSSQTEKNEPNFESSEKVVADSKFYKIGDLVDVIYEELGAWFEAKITGIFVDEIIKNVSEEDLTFQVVMDREEQTAPLCVESAKIRPRAKYRYNISELKPEMVIFVNYNIKKPREIGYWYDLRITNIDKRNRVYGTLLMGNMHSEIHRCSLKFLDDLMKIEKPTLLSERIDDIDSQNIPLRKLPLYCKQCKDVKSQDCRNCSCGLCGKKDFVDKLIICDECDVTFHLFCLTPPLSEVPAEPEWYCPECKIDENEIIKAGENLKHVDNIPRQIFESTNTFLKIFGAIEGIEVGTWWNSKVQISEDKVHNNLTTNIDADNNGVYSMILETEQEVQQDNGYEFYYTVYTEYKLSDDTETPLQYFPKILKLLIKNCNDNTQNCRFGFGKPSKWSLGKPIRVIRSGNLSRFSKFAPKSGYRYDGLYKVMEYFPEVYENKVIIWRFLLRRRDRVPAPWIVIKQEYRSKVICTEVNLSNSNKKLKTDAFHLDENVIKFIDNDTVNEKLWQECRKKIDQGKEEFLKTIKEMFTCVCCQDVVVTPVTTSCKHNICYECLKRCFHSEIYSCPNCRVELDGKIITRVNHNLNAALRLIFQENAMRR